MSLSAGEVVIAVRDVMRKLGDDSSRFRALLAQQEDGGGELAVRAAEIVRNNPDISTEDLCRALDVELPLEGSDEIFFW